MSHASNDILPQAVDNQQFALELLEALTCSWLLCCVLAREAYISACFSMQVACDVFPEVACNVISLSSLKAEAELEKAKAM